MAYINYSGLRDANYAAAANPARVSKPVAAVKPPVKIEAPPPVVTAKAPVVVASAAVVINDTTPAIAKVPVAEQMKPLLSTADASTISAQTPAIIDKIASSKVLPSAAKNPAKAEVLKQHLFTAYYKVKGAPKKLLDRVERAVVIPFQRLGAFLEKKFPILFERVKKVTAKGTENLKCFVKTYPATTGVAITVLIIICIVWAQKKRNKKIADLVEQRDKHHLRACYLDQLLHTVYPTYGCYKSLKTAQMLLGKTEEEAFFYVFEQIKITIEQEEQEATKKAEKQNTATIKQRVRTDTSSPVPIKKEDMTNWN
ncbi:MAG: hypothetical protein SP4CHLAM5_05270 [Chlamydiia bacterium]|nr:hypothetical protein [Chlamydiia bacterium]MCH9618398.1 hypothetical protein [Chlamydiia bacterium]MCH9624284.1 hypothetical protein [Chlamydiia bacterium]